MAEQLIDSTVTPSAVLAGAGITSPATTTSVVAATHLPGAGVFTLLLKGTATDGSDDGIIAVGAIAGTALSSITWVRVGQGTFPAGTEVEVVMDARALAALIDGRADTRIASDTTKQSADSDLTAFAALNSSTSIAPASDGAGWLGKTAAQFKTWLGLVKADVGLANVDNTSDANKPVSTAQAAADAAVAAAAQPLDTDLTAIAGFDSTQVRAIASDGAGWISKTATQFKTWLGLVKGDVGLGNVDNTSDIGKPVSTAQAAADSAVAAASQPVDADLTTIAAITPGAGHVLAADGAGWVQKTYAALKTSLGLTKSDVGLGNVDNTSDVNKPVSTAQAAADATKQPLDTQLTEMASLVLANDDVIQQKAGALTNRTIAQLAADLDAGGMATDAALAAHEADTTAIHGITDTSKLATTDTAQTITAVKTHSADIIANANIGLGGVLFLPAGSAAAPSIDDGSGTGIYTSGGLVYFVVQAMEILSSAISTADAYLIIPRPLKLGRLALSATGTIAKSAPPIVGVTATAAPITLTLPNVSQIHRWITIKDESGGAATNNITVARGGTALIDGATSVVINTNYGYVTLYSNGTNWSIVARG